MKKCQFCGKDYIEKELNVFGMKRKIEIATCNCYDEYLKQQENKRVIELKKARIQKIFDNSMMTPLFRKKKFENVEMTDIVKKCKKYADNFSTEKTKGISFIGNVGTGKTTGLACLCNELMEKGHPCIFTTFSELLNKFSNYSYNHAGDITPLLDDLCRCDLIVLDDMFRQTETEKRREIAFLIIDRLMNYEIPLCYTANFETYKNFKKIPEWDAIFDRLKVMTDSEILKGESLRGKNGIRTDRND